MNKEHPSKLATLAPGDYFIGDPSLILPDPEWPGRGDPLWAGRWVVAGQPVWAAAVGCDGWYEDADGHRYAVDSGTLGAVRLQGRSAHRRAARQTGLGRIVVFDDWFECRAVTMLASDGGTVCEEHGTAESHCPCCGDPIGPAVLVAGKIHIGRVEIPVWYTITGTVLGAVEPIRNGGHGPELSAMALEAVREVNESLP